MLMFVWASPQGYWQVRRRMCTIPQAQLSCGFQFLRSCGVWHSLPLAYYLPFALTVKWTPPPSHTYICPPYWITYQHFDGCNAAATGSSLVMNVCSLKLLRPVYNVSADRLVMTCIRSQDGKLSASRPYLSSCEVWNVQQLSRQVFWQTVNCRLCLLSHSWVI